MKVLSERGVTGRILAGLAAFVLSGLIATGPARAVDPSDGGLGVSLDLLIWNTGMGQGSTVSGGTIITTESTLTMAQPRLVLSWGLDVERFFVQPRLLLGFTKDAELHGGELIIGPLRFPGTVGEIEAFMVGAGLDLRFKLQDSRLSFGLSGEILHGKGKARSWFNNSPSEKTDLDAEFASVEAGIVVQYNDPHFRPWVLVGLRHVENEFRNPDDHRADFRVKSREVFGMRAGVDIRNIAGTAMDLKLQAGYIGGLELGLGIVFRFKH